MSDTIYDISHWQGQVDFAAAKASGMEAVILKCTEGLHSADPMYAANWERATAAGLLVGSYHFGNGNDGNAQADHFLNAVKPGILVLDFEQNEPQMTTEEAHTFCYRIYEKTGKWPGLYADHGHFAQLDTVPDLSACWRWVAKYSVVPPDGEWLFWQYTQSGAVAGVEGHCDRSRCSAENMQAVWAANRI